MLTWRNLILCIFFCLHRLTLVCSYRNIEKITSQRLSFFNWNITSNLTSYLTHHSFVRPSSYQSPHSPHFHSLTTHPPSQSDVVTNHKKSSISWRSTDGNAVPFNAISRRWCDWSKRLLELSVKAPILSTLLKIDPLNQFTESCLSCVAKLWFGNSH